MVLFRCDPCGFYFESVRALQNHGKTSPQHASVFGRRCPQCNIVYPSSSSLIRHYIESSSHHYCSYCNEHFETVNDFILHNSNRHNGSDTNFDSVKNDDTTHTIWYCIECDLAFQSRRDLYIHWKSTTHTTQQYTCPGNDCSKAFGAPSAVIQHLESSACASGMTRQRVNRMAIAADRGAVITDRARIAADNERLSMPESVATTAWFNGSSYECIICHRTCRTLVGLNRHLRSPAHSEKIFKCPRQWSGCGKAFNTLSGLVQHVESGVCGVRKFAPELSPSSGGRLQISFPDEETTGHIPGTSQYTPQPLRTESAGYSSSSYPRRRTYAESIQSFPGAASNTSFASSTKYSSPAFSQSNTYTRRSTYGEPQQSFPEPRSYTPAASLIPNTYVTYQRLQQPSIPTYRRSQESCSCGTIVCIVITLTVLFWSIVFSAIVVAVWLGGAILSAIVISIIYRLLKAVVYHVLLGRQSRY